MEDIEDNDFVASEHDILVQVVSKLDKTQHIIEPTRSEPTNLNSEFNLTKRENKVNLNNVLKVLKDTANHIQISKKLKKSQDRSKVLPKPLEKPQAARIKRATGYEENKKKVGRWDAVVARSRTVDFVSFPLNHTYTKLHPTLDFLSKLTLKSTLEKELDEIDPPACEENDEDEEQIYPMSYEEMVEHRQHSAKLRAQQSYKAAKAKRQSKIKSKKYHRILKKDKLKQQLKEFEELQQTNPEEALQKLETLEKSRALERHTLRHKNTGKWARNQLIRAKYDKDVRQQLAEQLAVSRSLTHKTKDVVSTDDEPDENEGIPNITLAQDPMNPWMLRRSDKSNVAAEYDFGYKKYLKDKMYQKKEESESDSSDEETKTNDQPLENLKVVKESINNISQNKIMSNDVEEYTIDTIAFKKVDLQKKLNSNTNEDKKRNKKPVIATSNWVVESFIGSDIKFQRDIVKQVSTAFESLESNIADQVEKKLKSLRADIEKLEKPKKQSAKIKRHKDVDNLEYLKIPSKKVKALLDEELIETMKINEIVDTETSPASILQAAATNTHKSGNPDIDPTKFIEVKPKYLNTALPNDDNDFDQLDDDEQVVPKVNIEEVFEEDDVVASFRQEKEDEINKNKPEDIDLSLPGWGSWGGKGVKAPKKKRNRFILKAPPQIPRKDENKGDIIIKEYKDPILASHKVTNVPFPFSGIKEYEASIRAPIGNTFVPEKAHKKLIRPNVITNAGTIIEPMDERELLVPKNRKFKNADIISLLSKK